MRVCLMIKRQSKLLPPGHQPQWRGAALPQVFDQLLAAPAPGSFAIDVPPLLHGLGLFQGAQARCAVQPTWATNKLLDHALMPRVAQAA